MQSDYDLSPSHANTPVDASDMINGDEVRNNIYSPTDIIRPADEPDKHKDEHAG